MTNHDEPLEIKKKKKDRRKKALKKLMKRKQITKRVKRGLQRRNRSERRFKWYGKIAVGLCFCFLVALLFQIITTGYLAFFQTKIKVPIVLEQELVADQRYKTIIKNGLLTLFPEATTRSQQRKLTAVISDGAVYELETFVTSHAKSLGTEQEIWLTTSSDVDMFVKHALHDKSRSFSRLNDNQQSWIATLYKQGRIEKRWNNYFFTRGDSREPELAGVLGAMMGSLFVIISCMLVAFPLGVLSAIYLEEFAPKNKLTEIIEVNLNNLAAVPSIVFGLLGLTLYIQWIGIPRSASLAGGLTLALMALPVMVIATRTSIRAIPQSIRDGAMALGASKLQTTLHHVLPLAMPGIMTGTILSVARVLGETAPLLMIGMVAFVVDVPHHFLEASTAMPVQIYLWSDSAEPGYVEKTSAAIIVLLGILILANLCAVKLRKKFEIKW